MVTDKKTSKNSRRTESKPKESTVDQNLDEIDISKDVKGILTAISAFKEKAAVELKHRNNSIISRLTLEFESALEKTQKEIEAERNNYVKVVHKVHKETETGLQEECNKFLLQKEKLMTTLKEYAKHCEEISSRYESQKEKLIAKGELLKKKEKDALENLKESCQAKLREAELSLRKRKHEERSITYLKKTLGSFFDGNEDSLDPDDDEADATVLEFT